MAGEITERMLHYRLTSDLHLGHANIIGYCNRPFHDVQSMDAALLQLLGKVVPGELLVMG